MKTLKYTIFFTLLAMASGLYAANSSGSLSRDRGNPGPEIQGGFKCVHTSESDPTPEIFYFQVGFVGDLSYCQNEHANFVASGGHRDDKNGNPEDCVISVDYLD